VKIAYAKMKKIASGAIFYNYCPPLTAFLLCRWRWICLFLPYLLMQ